MGAITIGPGTDWAPADETHPMNTMTAHHARRGIEDSG